MLSSVFSVIFVVFLQHVWCSSKESNLKFCRTKTVVYHLPTRACWCNLQGSNLLQWLFRPPLWPHQLKLHIWGNQWGTIPYYQFHRLGCEPLHYGHRCLAPGVGIEPTIAESKSVVLPLHYPGSKIGGSSRIRTHGPFRAFSFQDCCLKPCSAILPYLVA